MRWVGGSRQGAAHEGRRGNQLPMSAPAEAFPLPTRLARRRSDGFEGRAARDRLSSMLILATLLHGLVLVGVTFTAPGGAGSTQRGLEVLLVSDELPEAGDNPTAAYIAQRSQEGSGNTLERLAAELPGERPQAEAAAGAPQPLDRFDDPLLMSSAPALSPIQIEAVPQQELLLTQQEMERLLAGDENLQLRGETREQLYMSPDTRASRLAPWLDGWRQRVEKIGTVNFPALARRPGMSGSLVLEVVVQNDGQLRSARIQRTSGHAELDEAAREILRLASPFDPFPPDLARDYRNLRFAYEWRFEGGQTSRSAVSLP